ncbi:MAG: hypothetical protein H6686_00695 [Fibrobacteria bacterium]|nr:hypothetical protein [Fibrobacteria bacterium]
MSREEGLIRRITEILPAAPERRTAVFSSDCEVARFGREDLLCTLDEFSAEDRLRTDIPERLGWNLACASLADVFACGGVPRLYSHAMVPAPQWSDAYLVDFCRGVASALRESGTGFLGGDWGCGTEWRYTTHVIGAPGERLLDRCGAREGDLLYITGKVGLGNLEAALGIFADHPLLRPASGLHRSRFRVLRREAKIVARYASACIDTSDGFVGSLLQLSDQSSIGFEIEGIPFVGAGKWASRILGRSILLLALGGCGEYELLFTVPAEREAEMREAARDERLVLHRVGVVRKEARSRRCHHGGAVLDLSKAPPQARDFPDLTGYMAELERFAKGVES